MSEIVEQHVRFAVAEIEGVWQILSIETSEEVTRLGLPQFNYPDGRPIELTILHRYIEVDRAALGGSAHLSAARMLPHVRVGSDAPMRLEWSSGTRMPEILRMYRTPRSKRNHGGPTDGDDQV